MGMSIRNEILRRILASIQGGVETAPIKSYHEHETSTEITLTSTPQLIDNWTATIDPVNFSEVNGQIVCAEDNLYQTFFERTYLNYDQSPIDTVNITLDIKANGVSIYTNTLPIAAATKTTEPAVLALTTPFLARLTEADYVEFYVSAEDDGLDPADCRLVYAKTSAHAIYL
jgi:hypothetical protein